MKPVLRHFRSSLFLCLTTLAGCSGSDVGPADLTLNESPAGNNQTGGTSLSPVSGTDASGTEASPLGGQSGGTSGAAPGPSCYCRFSPLAVARVVNPGVDGQCAVFELVEKPDSSDYFGLEIGDTFGGNAASLCEDALNASADDLVYVHYSPANTAGLGCPEYKTCSQNECGDFDPEAPDQAAVWDQCDSTCLEDTRDVCASHAQTARYSGGIIVAGIGDNNNVVFTDENTYSVPPSELADEHCNPSAVSEPDNATSGAGDAALPLETAGDAPPPAPDSAPTLCAIPD